MEIPELALWRSVIGNAISDGLSKQIKTEDRDKAIRWFKEDHKDCDFHYVCALADLDPRCVRQSFFNLLNKQCRGDD